MSRKGELIWFCPACERVSSTYIGLLNQGCEGMPLAYSPLPDELQPLLPHLRAVAQTEVEGLIEEVAK